MFRSRARYFLPGVPKPLPPPDLRLHFARYGDEIDIYYAPNSWNFTRLGRINDTTAEELKELPGSGDVEVTLSLPE